MIKLNNFVLYEEKDNIEDVFRTNVSLEKSFNGKYVEFKDGAIINLPQEMIDDLDEIKDYTMSSHDDCTAYACLAEEYLKNNGYSIRHTKEKDFIDLF